MEEAKTMKTLMSSSIKLDKDKKGKHPAEPSQPGGTLKTRFDTTLFSFVEDYQRYKQHFAQRQVVPERNINFPQLQHFRFDGLFTRMEELIRLDSESICRIFDTAPVGLKFGGIYGLPNTHKMSKPSAHSLTDVDVYLSRETDFESPSTYDTYDDQSMGRMKFEKALNGSWFEATFSESMLSEPTFTTGPSTQPSYTEPSSGPTFAEPTHTKIPPPQAPLTPDHAPWMNLSTRISSLGTRMEELVVASLHSFSIANRGLSVLRIAWSVQHEEMMAYLRSMFPPPPPQP
ncbi:hypothetical protein CK203_113691 [Vitis vinifera]|uniref:Uncharacterized protein n=1 Tax=Vitis vinifera TaxID=29760 RepID=A0A438CCB7_VITVI|nr:hypothetical protein CK203_113691 [Vitis vinifera]